MGAERRCSASQHPGEDHFWSLAVRLKGPQATYSALDPDREAALTANAL